MSETIAFKPESLQQVHKIMARYPEGRQKSALLPVLHLAQKEFGGWLDVPVMDYVAELLSIKPIEVYEVATFYTMFNMKPVGKYVLEVCRTGPCMVRGSEKILDHIRTKLNIKDGQTTEDGMFTLKPA
ncbi:MAG: NAD(P)H-dependent oxidoreductase subunit E, partial [Chryseobacterium sp.]